MILLIKHVLKLEILEITKKIGFIYLWLQSTHIENNGL